MASSSKVSNWSNSIFQKSACDCWQAWSVLQQVEDGFVQLRRQAHRPVSNPTVGFESEDFDQTKHCFPVEFCRQSRMDRR